jgi:hypothetical protein
MYPDASSHRTAAGAHMRHVLDTIANCGPHAARVLAAEEQRREAARCAAVWAATHAARERTPGAGRRWLGTLLIRAGGRLQGAQSAPGQPSGVPAVALPAGRSPSF